MPLTKAEVGRLMGEKPAEEWSVMTADESAGCITFAEHTHVMPRQACEEWFEAYKRDFPESVKANGYHIVRVEVWPDYLGEYGDCAASARFMNWAFRLPLFEDVSNLERVLCAVRNGQSVQMALSAFLGASLSASMA